MNSSGRDPNTKCTSRGVIFPYGIPGSLNTINPHHVSRPPRLNFKEIGVSSNLTRVNQEVNQSEEPAKPCRICDRPRTTVSCTACGYRRANLRTQVYCPDHGKVKFLYDLTECPGCGTANLVEED